MDGYEVSFTPVMTSDLRRGGGEINLASLK